MRNRSILCLVLPFIAAAMLASGCDKGNEDASPAGANGSSIRGQEEVHAEPFEVTIRHTQVGESKKFRLAILKDVVRQTEADIPGLKIRLDAVDSEVNRKEKLRGEMAAGKPPDIFDVFGSPDSGIYAREGLMLDLTPILDELGLKHKIRGLEPYTHDGKVYGLPAGASIEGFFIIRLISKRRGFMCPGRLTSWSSWPNSLRRTAKFRLPSPPRKPGFR